jgi:steroid delta-isomerase
MTTEFSFGKLMRHLTSGTELPRPAGLPTEEHMRKAVQGYIDNLNNPDPDYVAKYLALPHTVEDPVGAKPMNVSSWDDVQDQMKDLIDVPFIPKRAELTAPISFSLGNKAAMAFTLWAEVDGRDISIDIIEVMTFDHLREDLRPVGVLGRGERHRARLNPATDIVPAPRPHRMAAPPTLRRAIP